MRDAEHLYDLSDWVMSMYVSGLAVETLLQAHALRKGASHDARHDLRAWLDKCPAPVVSAVKGRASAEWSQLNVLWSNELRYLSVRGLLGLLREKGQGQRISGGPSAIIKVCARRCLVAADVVHKKGVALWSPSRN